MAVTLFKSSDNFNMAGFNEKITEADNTYVAKTGDSMTGALSMGNNKITDVASPVNDGDAANKGYVDGWNTGYTLVGTLTSGIGGAGGGTWNDLIVPFNGLKVIEFLFHFKNYKLTGTSYGDGSILFGYPSNTYFGMVVIGKDTTDNTFNGIVKSFPNFIDNSKNSAMVNEIFFNKQSGDRGAKDATYTKVTMQGVSSYQSGSVDIYAKLIP